jgi:hypothetical protein
MIVGKADFLSLAYRLMRTLPQAVFADLLAVVAAALVIVDVVSPMSSAGNFTVFAFANKQVKEARQQAAEIRSPSVWLAPVELADHDLACLFITAFADCASPSQNPEACLRG